jgi:tetratricopeptide (TPR) repeat protein
MNTRILILLLFSFFDWMGISWDFRKISRENEVIQQAKEAFHSGEYDQAILHFIYLKDSLVNPLEALTFNLASAYYLNKDSVLALETYQSVYEMHDPFIRSAARQMSGVISNKEGKAEEALAHFKQALKADPSNEDARYNYELLKKMLERKKREEEKKKDWPSDYAKKLKEEADRLVAQYKFNEAFEVLYKGLEVDPSVMFYQEFLLKLAKIIEIDANL